jgi:hypothetical protein
MKALGDAFVILDGKERHVIFLFVPIFAAIMDNVLDKVRIILKTIK